MKANATKMTAEQVKAHSMRDYNPRVWEENVESALQRCTDVEFYLLDRGVYDYERFLVVYTLPEGIRLARFFGYGGSITNGGFYELWINTMDTDEAVRLVQAGQQDKVDECMFPEDRVSIQSVKIPYKKEDGTIEYGLIGTSQQARNVMIERSQRFGHIFTKDLI